MTETETAWLAGLLEGEGYFCLKLRPKGRPQIRVGLSMTDQDIVERAAALMHAPSVRERVFASKKNSWSAEVYGYVAESVMRVVRPHMGERRGAKIDELLAMEGLLSHHDRI